jgi:hypothetical protein
MESRVLPKKHARFGERNGGNRLAKSRYGVPVSTPRDPNPSPEDIRCTERIVQGGKMIDIDVLDHIIVGKGGRFASLKEKGLGFS